MRPTSARTGGKFYYSIELAFDFCALLIASKLFTDDYT